MKKAKNRWLIALCAVGIHLSIGSVYAWSVFTNPLADKFGWSLSQISLTFSIAILCLGLSAAFLGHFVEKHGPRKAGMLAACFFGVGVTFSGAAVQLGSLPLLYLFYGVFGGIGLGVGYITPVSSLVKWFPDRRGLATGLAIMGFGFAALISGPVMQLLINAAGIANTFFILGICYFLIMMCSSLYLSPPEKGWQPKRLSPEKTRRMQNSDLSQLTANEAVKTKRFYYLWLMLFINVTCGIAIISIASPLAQESAGMSAAGAAVLVGVLGAFNGFGRIGWASVSDYIGRPNTYTIFFAVQLIAFPLLPFMRDHIMFSIFMALIYTCYGGGFATIPAYIGDLFGTRELGAIHGYILTAWAAAGLAGPMFSSWIRDVTGGYGQSLTVFAGLFGIGLLLSGFMRADMKQLRKKADILLSHSIKG
ncbi:OFA family MFS transporter [Bacillus sonorensis]|uniref:L-lactate MFS transporter n=1 Tax=Bacillus TaxID=1386 RepID=UPI0004953A4A|nr:OFA family MFS transporter [Bacillus sonorensis]MBG9914460.1 MFS transporter [Bacillus sonorensis]MCF7616278.1 OFA family MFS transporter [Bacillus sonorensis]MCY8023706.1 OFA family MFS transporter [Bacillus sonorensis]MCY8032956.1 OFA family MFS transporter [Bacillus sonorensis]MCY8089235.1 OFA family MFS transporter [Bacillus sonorensis]